MKNKVLAALCGLWGTVMGAPQMEWKWSNPQPSGNNLIHVAFQDSEHGLIVADNGEVSETSDGGETWSLHKGRIDNDYLVAATTLDAHTLIALSGAGRIWRTTDGGQTWTKAASYAQNLMQISHCGDRTVLATGMGGIMVRSTDGGIHWTQSTPDGEDAFFLSLHCSQGLAFAVGDSGRVLSSQDGGRTWVSKTRPTSRFLTSVAFADSLHGFVTTDRGSVAETRDGGRTWRLSLLDSLNFLSGIESQGSRWRVIGSNGSIWTSWNAGLSWVRSDTVTSLYLSASVMFGTSSGITVGNNGLILKEEDRGNRWKIIRRGSSQYLDGLAPITAQSWVAFGYPGVVLKTDDAGTSWREIRVRPDTVRFFAGAFQASDETSNKVSDAGARGILTGDDGTILHSQDAGETWHEAQIPGKGPRLFGVAWCGPRIAYAVGDSGTLWRTQDAGQTWSASALPPGLGQTTLSTVVFQDRGRGWVAGYQGTLLRTENLGETWSLVPTASQEDLFALSFRDASTGLAVGSQGVVLRTRDGGMTWERGTLSLGRDDEFSFGIHWLSGDTALAVGDWGHGWYLRMTADAGRTWSNLTLPTRKNLWAMASPVKGQVALMGQDGALLLGSLHTESTPPVFGPADGSSLSFTVQRAGATDHLLAQLRLASKQSVSLSAATLSGRQLGLLYRGNLDAGPHTLRLPYSRRGPCLIRIEGVNAQSRVSRTVFLPY